MQFSLEKDLFHYVVHSCTTDGVLISTPASSKEAEKPTLQTGSFIITPGSLEDWSRHSVQEFSSDDTERLLSFNPEIVILGTGERHEWPEMAVFEPLYAKNVGLEVMRTDAACRTYNLLTSDRRNVVAAIIC